jgi:TPR repeat protein
MTRPALLSVQKLLETARDLSLGEASTLSYLAEIQGDLGLTAPALDHAQRGAGAAPAEVYAQMALARAQWNARQTAAAQATAAQALTLARVASQKQRVKEFLAFAAANKRAQATGSKPYRTQFGPPPAGAFGATRAVGGGGRVTVGSARTDSIDASALTDCFANRNDAACARAVPALEVACAEKQAASCVSLGSLYDGGFGVIRDRRKAAGAYRTACDLSDKPGCARLAVLEEQGLGVPRNATRASKTLEALCREKVPEACIGLAQILQRTGYATDRARARALLKSTCDEGSAEACALLTSR